MCTTSQQRSRPLPPKLRDMVYGFILDSPGVKVDPLDFSRQHFDRQVLTGRFCDPFQSAYHCDWPELKDKTSYAHLFDVNFVDSVTRSEFAATWYLVGAFPLTRFRNLDQLLQYDRWGNAIHPHKLVNKPGNR
jgi:hypothetical protein